MKLIVRGDTEYGDSSTQAIEVKPKYFNPKYLEAYMGDEGEEVLVKTYKVVEPEQPKECEHEEGGKEEHDHLGTYHVGSETCCKCGKHMNDWEQPAQEIALLCGIDYSEITIGALTNKINELIEAVNELKKKE
jgi:hypothetical protein